MNELTKFLILSACWLAGALLLIYYDSKTPVIVISAVILIRSYVIETNRKNYD